MTDAALVHHGAVQRVDTDRDLYTALSVATALHHSETLEWLTL